MSHHHVLLISMASHGHLNPTIQLAKNFIRAGTRATLFTSVSCIEKIKSLPSNKGLSFAFFSDGHDDNINASTTPGYTIDHKRFGSESLASLIQDMSVKGYQVTLLVYTLFIPWAAVVAREHNVPSAMFVIQSATSFWIYQRFFNNRDGIYVVHKDIDDTSISLKLPGLPLLKRDDLPTFVFPTSPVFSNMISVCQQHMQFLEQNPNHPVLVNTLEGLEPDSMKFTANAIVVGPLVTYSSSLTDDRDSYFGWLDLKQENSVVYVSFGSMVVLTKTQKEELLYGLIESSRPFLLVLRDDGENEDQEMVELKTKVGDNGLIVRWCSQMDVLKHDAIGCFVTHCGWNSTLESLVAGVAIVGCPQVSDQTTNAKMVDEVWGNGVRAVMDEAMVVRREEIKRCLEVVMDGGDRAKEIKKNVDRWRKVAEESVKDDGSLQVNLKLLLQSILVL